MKFELDFERLNFIRMHIETELSVLDRELNKVETLDIVFVYTTFKVGRLCETHEMIQMEGRDWKSDVFLRLFTSLL